MNKELIGGFVFVVCGANEHLNTLRVSYGILLKKTNVPIFIVTDNSRNEHPLNYSNTLDIKTPSEFDHHQASIWLKTSLHKILPSGKIYTYLDTDVLAYHCSPDEIFKEFIAPISFANDHCIMPQFGLYAVNCGCLELFESKRNAVLKLQYDLDPCARSNDNNLLLQRNKLFLQFRQAQSTILKTFFFYLKYCLSWPYFKIENGFKYDKRKKIWMDNTGQTVMHRLNMKKIAQQTGLKWKILRNKLTLPDGRNVWMNSCNHLHEQIKKKFNISISDFNWQHWNGGVFIFSDDSYEFMETWHNYTMEVFKDPAWKTRDQGTLIATVWKLGLQDHPTLDNKWNMILDFYNQELEILNDGSITVDGKSKKMPELVHIYHHWGDTTWDVWNKTMQFVER